MNYYKKMGYLHRPPISIIKNQNYICIIIIFISSPIGLMPNVRRPTSLHPYTICSCVKQIYCPWTDITINKYYIRFCLTCQICNKRPCLIDLTCRENMSLLLQSAFFQAVQHMINLLIRLNLMPLQRIHTLEQPCISRKKTAHCHKGIHNFYAHLYSCFTL